VVRPSEKSPVRENSSDSNFPAVIRILAISQRFFSRFTDIGANRYRGNPAKAKGLDFLYDSLNRAKNLAAPTLAATDTSTAGMATGVGERPMITGTDATVDGCTYPNEHRSHELERSGYDDGCKCECERKRTRTHTQRAAVASVNLEHLVTVLSDRTGIRCRRHSHPQPCLP
jgi:hypothetical protein